MHKRWLCVLALFVGGALVLPVGAQEKVAPADQPAATPAAAPVATPAPAPQDSSAPAQAAPPTWSVGPIDFAGTLDVYYNYNGNHPASGVSSGYNFDDRANTFNLNLLKLGMSHTPDPVGFEFDLGFGETMNLINQSAAGASGGFANSEFDKYVEQAYVSLKPMSTKGFELDLGKFVTFAGAEVIESYSNWNYSRSLLFTNAIPYDHTGLRLSMPFGKHLTTGFQLVNGWNNSIDDNFGKTLGVNTTLTYSKFAWAADWYGGPENAGTDKGWSHLFDTTLTLTPTGKLSAYINYDYHQNRSFTTNTASFLNTGRGLAAAIHFAPTSKWSFTPRVEWWRSNFFSALNNPPDIYELTFTGEYKLLEGLLWRGEYRYDWANQRLYEYGISGNIAHHENTATIAMVAFFGPKR